MKRRKNERLKLGRALVRARYSPLTGIACVCLFRLYCRDANLMMDRDRGKEPEMVQVADAPRLVPREILDRIAPQRVATRTPRLSIVIVNYAQWENTAALVRQLRRCASVRNGIVEIVIVDNHSPRHKLM